MTMTRLFFAAAALALIAGCTTTPEPCTRDYFVYQADQLKREFARRNSGEVRRLRTLRDDLQSQPDVFTALAVLSAKSDLETVVEDVRTRIMPKARAIADRCGIDEGFDVMMDGFLYKQGIDPQLVRTLGLPDLFEAPDLETTLQPANQGVC